MLDYHFTPFTLFHAYFTLLSRYFTVLANLHSFPEYHACYKVSNNAHKTGKVWPLSARHLQEPRPPLPLDPPRHAPDKERTERESKNGFSEMENCLQEIFIRGSSSFAICSV